MERPHPTLGRGSSGSSPHRVHLVTPQVLSLPQQHGHGQDSSEPQALEIQGRVLEEAAGIENIAGGRTVQNRSQFPRREFMQVQGRDALRLKGADPRRASLRFLPKPRCYPVRHDQIPALGQAAAFTLIHVVNA